MRIAKLNLTKLIFTCLALLSLGTVHAASTAMAIDADVGQAVADFRKTVKGAEEYLAAAKGVLVIPEVQKAGLIVGGQWGEGALQINGKSVAFYSMKAASVGMQAGYQKANYVFIFLTQESLDQFRKSKGWDAGVDGGVTVIDESIGASVDTLKAKSSVVAFIFGKEGLMGGLSVKGQKLTRINPK